ncbi:hypothetical protein CEUSTIGMA_g740.t1 [Chlamydomonas eustigma]|uniref:Inward rectifier potassium channel C-terminal domain-containing protein n=1 Tax=Chlamydomonas eustigma TaxID=1157962 RepID=A0A250WRG1_9CHLO|nr:hypothetical protein CEUSTIGMA_g740.t1 [Chlamydomonas eustigma]|eukprot:GAX73286.1 hypothetical protein CEUSTIGMA_g740.t1 [Chlamydomonas eustigma]
MNTSNQLERSSLTRFAPESSTEPLHISETGSSAKTTTATQRLNKWKSQGLKTLSRMKIPFKVPSLIDRSQPYFSGIARFGVVTFWNLWNDPFHTLLNMQWGSFILVFFSTYITEFFIFALLFYVQGSGCVSGMDNKFSNALWLSSRTASTLGYNQISPNPDCTFTNLCVMFEVIASSLVNFIMLGMVFARFSAPFKRASSVRFSKEAVCHSHPSGYWAISLRVANLRKHQILQPSIRMVVTAIDSITPSNYMFEHLKLENTYQQETNLELGFPANLIHVITPDSFLYNLSLLEMDTRMMEILVFVDGIDAMTSKHMSARFSYASLNILLNQVHVPLNLEMRGKKLGLDFNDFDRTILASAALEAELALRENAGAGSTPHAATAAAAAGAAATASLGWQLKHQTFKRLAERYSTAALMQPERTSMCFENESFRSMLNSDTPVDNVGIHLNKHRRPPTSAPAGLIERSSEISPLVCEERAHEVSLYMGGGGVELGGSEGGTGLGKGRLFHDQTQPGPALQYTYSDPQPHLCPAWEEGRAASSQDMLHMVGQPAVAVNGGCVMYRPPVAIGSTGVVLPAAAAANAPHLMDPSVAGLAPYAVPPSAHAQSVSLMMYGGSVAPQNGFSTLPSRGASQNTIGATSVDPFMDHFVAQKAPGSFPPEAPFGSGASFGGHLPLSSAALEPEPLPHAGAPASSTIK